MKKILIALLMSCLLNFHAYAAEADLRGRVIGASFKGLANTYLAAVDFEKEKKKFVESLEKTPDEAFEMRYDAYWPLIEELPVRFKVQYGLTNHMTRKELTDRVKALKKEDFQQAISAVPDEVVTQEFDRRVKRMGKKIQESDMAKQIETLWQRILKKAEQLGGKKP